MVDDSKFKMFWGQKKKQTCKTVKKKKKTVLLRTVNIAEISEK